MGSTLREFVAEDMWLLIGVVTFATAGLAAISGLGTLSSAIGVVGWFLLAPIFLFWGEEVAAVAFGESGPERATPADRERDAVEELKRRYADGEIDDAEFERRLDRILAVDDALEGAFADRGDRSSSVEDAPGREAASESAADDERDPEVES
jgi:uncharacterized membrane protein